MLEEIQKITRPYEAQGINFHLAGPPVLNVALNNTMRRDLRLFAPISIISVLVILVLVFRSFQAVFYAILTALMALVWSLGLMPLTNTPMSLGLSMMIPLVLAMALVYAIRYLNCFYRQPPLGKFHHDGQNECYSALVVPSLLCGITTRVGFLSLGMSPLPGIREMGIYVGFGILACIWFTSVFLPALLIGIPISEEVFTRITGPILLDE